MTGLANKNPLRFIIPGLFLTGLLVLSYRVLQEFLPSLVWAFIIAYVMWPGYQRLKSHLHNNATLSAGLMTAAITAVISLAVVWLVAMLQDELKLAYQALVTQVAGQPLRMPAALSGIPGLGDYLQTWLDRINNDQAGVGRQFVDWAKQWLGLLAGFVGGLGHNVMKLGVVFVTVFFCFRDGEAALVQLRQGLIHYLGSYQEAYLQAAGDTTRAVVYGLVLAALGQGVLAGVGYLVAGVQAPVLFAVITALLALVPMGATLIWLPLGISLILSGELWSGMGLLLWGFFAISTVDNVIRPIVISGASRVPFLVVMFGVFGGLRAFGAVGLFLGPVILAVLLSVWQAWIKQQRPVAEEQPTAAAEAVVWHSLSVADALSAQAVDAADGLSHSEAAARFKTYGANKLAETPPRPAWHLFLAQFNSVLIGVLIGAAVLAAAIGDLKDGIVILVVVIINAMLSFYQEFQAEKSLSALKKMLALKATVRRDGTLQEILAEHLVPGDIVVLEAGNKIPADGRIVVAHALAVDESSLTGESMPVTKHAAALVNKALPLAERVNTLYMNNAVTSGRGEMVVTATGMATEIGRLAQLLSTADTEDTPLQIQLDSLGKRLALVALVVVVVLFAAAMLRHEPMLETLFTAIALAVAAIPEGLPAVVTVTLALGMHRMAKQQAIVKRLAAVETLGCTTVICTDKTGTLTVNQMTARALFYRGQKFQVSGEGYALAGTISPALDTPADHAFDDLLLALVLCNNSRLQADEVLGDPMESALLVLAHKGGMSQAQAEAELPRVGEIPFAAEHKFMATFHRHGDGLKVFVKGAPEVVLALCRTDTDTETVLQHNELLASAGLRVLAVAARVLDHQALPSSQGDLLALVQQLEFVALVGLMDPPRAEARAAIKLCQQAGIAVKMITGDQQLTGVAIANELGLTGEVLAGTELALLSDGQLAARINGIGVFARIAPEQKVRIVKALKADGHIVAMTGDGVNDAPALKAADMGIAMGITGTDVAKEAAGMILTDDNFATIVMAIKEGRGIYENMVKFIRFQLSTNIGAILTVAGAPLLGMPVPFTAVQLLWINIIMDGPPAMSLGVDPSRPDNMRHAPRDPEARILSLRRFGNLFAYGLTMAIGTLALLFYGLQTGDPAHATTLAFHTFVLFQVFNVFNARSERGSLFTRQLFTNRLLWLALLAVLVLQVLVIYWQPAEALFHTTALSAVDWLLAGGVAASVVVLEELRKAVFRKRRG